MNLNQHILSSLGPAQIASVIAVPVFTVTGIALKISTAVSDCKHGGITPFCENHINEADDICSRDPDCEGKWVWLGKRRVCSHYANQERDKLADGCFRISALFALHCVPILGGIAGYYVQKR